MAWNEAVAQAYARLVLEGKRDISDIKPEDLKIRVKEILGLVGE